MGRENEGRGREMAATPNVCGRNRKEDRGTRFHKRGGSGRQRKWVLGDGPIGEHVRLAGVGPTSSPDQLFLKKPCLLPQVWPVGRRDRGQFFLLGEAPRRGVRGGRASGSVLTSGSQEGRAGGGSPQRRHLARAQAPRSYWSHPGLPCAATESSYCACDVPGPWKPSGPGGWEGADASLFFFRLLANITNCNLS